MVRLTDRGAFEYTSISSQSSKPVVPVGTCVWRAEGVAREHTSKRKIMSTSGNVSAAILA